MTQGEWRAPDPALLSLRRRVAVVATLSAGAALAALAWWFLGPDAAGVVVLVVLVALAGLLVVVERRYRSWGYAEREDDLLVRRGVLIRRVSVVPYGRMQYVDVTAGPLDRRYGLATVTLHTAAAASDAQIPGLREEEAVRLRDRLAALGEARAAGL